MFQQDGSLGNRRTSTWDDPTESLHGGITPMTLPDDLPDGNYALWLGVYFWENGERLLLADGALSLLLSTVQISKP